MVIVSAAQLVLVLATLLQHPPGRALEELSASTDVSALERIAASSDAAADFWASKLSIMDGTAPMPGHAPALPPPDTHDIDVAAIERDSDGA